jgi:hypothetical protein
VILRILVFLCLLGSRDLLAQTADVSNLPDPIRPTTKALMEFDSTEEADDQIPQRGYSPGKSQINWTRFAIATGGLTATIAALHIYQLNAWWSEQRVPFHVFDDPDYKDNFDKAGHAFGAYYAGHFFDEAFTWSGMDSAQSTALAATCAALWELYIEMEDGYARDWGFSKGDAQADITGALFYLARNRVPFLRNFKYKWTYFPSKNMLRGEPDIPGQTLTVIEDYAGQSYWLSVNVNGILPESARGYWPDWLNLALGWADYSLFAPGLPGPDAFRNRHKAWMLSLDYDVSKMLPETSSGLLNLLIRGLDYWHLPAPALRLTPDPRLFILFPFRMSIG